MSKKILIYISVIFLTKSIAFSQDFNNIGQYRDSLNSLFSSLFEFDGTRFVKSDSEKVKINNKILDFFPKVLNLDSAYLYDFRIKTFGSIYSDDKKIRIITWNIKFSDGEFKYFGYLLHKNNKHTKAKVFPLNDKSSEIAEPYKQTLNNLNWFGCLYYQIVATKYAGTKYYTLLGWDGNSYLSKKKIIEILYFSRGGKPKFGKYIFRTQKRKIRKKRIIFEFSSQTVMALNYDKRYKAIVFDHLSPSSPSYKGIYQYYGPDFSYDSFKFEKGKWVLYEDIKVKNPKKRK